MGWGTRDLQCHHCKNCLFRTKNYAGFRINFFISLLYQVKNKPDDINVERVAIFIFLFHAISTEDIVFFFFVHLPLDGAILLFVCVEVGLYKD